MLYRHLKYSIIGIWIIAKNSIEIYYLLKHFAKNSVEIYYLLKHLLKQNR